MGYESKNAALAGRAPETVSNICDANDYTLDDANDNRFIESSGALYRRKGMQTVGEAAAHTLIEKASHSQLQHFAHDLARYTFRRQWSGPDFVDSPAHLNRGRISELQAAEAPRKQDIDYFNIALDLKGGLK